MFGEIGFVEKIVISDEDLTRGISVTSLNHDHSMQKQDITASLDCRGILCA